MNEVYFIKCDHCGHLNLFKTEFVTFCESCSKKLTNNYPEWIKNNPNKSLENFRKEVCVKSQTQSSDEIKTKKIKPAFLLSSLIIVACLLLTFGYYYYGNIQNFFLPENTSESILKGDWKPILYGKYGITVAAPEKLKKTSIEIPEGFDQYIKDAESFSYQPSKKFNVRINSVLYNEGIPLNLNGAYQGIINELANKKGVSNLEFKESPVISDDVSGLFIEGSFHEQGEFMRFQCVVYVRKSIMWQVWISFRDADKVAKVAAEKIMDSVKINYFVKSV